MYSTMLAEVICATFMEGIGKFQISKPSSKAMTICFRCKIDFDKEEGYRGVNMLLYAPMNYVQVWSQDWSDIVSLDDMEWNEEAEELCLKKARIMLRRLSHGSLLGIMIRDGETAYSCFLTPMSVASRALMVLDGTR